MVLLRHKGGNKRPQRRKSREREETGLLQEKRNVVLIGFNILVISGTEKKSRWKEMVVQQRLMELCYLQFLTLKDHWEKNYSKKHPKTAKRKISTNKFELIVQ